MKEETITLMVHDDGGCEEFLNKDGECPKCNFHPDMQSTAFKKVPLKQYEAMRRKPGRTFLGLYREPK